MKSSKLSLFIIAILMLSTFTILVKIPEVKATTSYHGITFVGMNVFPNDFTMGTEMANYPKSRWQLH